ncbi:unnamed protein product [Cuscuta campestris]|uniref:No apical meristem-associated C-terminal domain-containing protein n=1 Tax=Cuscuta campestris TaxID=132261 RepID=A0A484MMT4_9ASTE|nr:unnamed protein product [Cuscuta campestris]VFQ89777.1 unnamed protein product [Cuscuta campestris]
MNPTGSGFFSDNPAPSDAAMWYYQELGDQPPIFETQQSGYVERDSVPETQPEPTGSKKSTCRKSHKTKGTMTEAARSIQKRTPEEECLLASAWVDVSEHPIIGSEQTKDAMWDRIEEKFFTAMNKDGSYRTRDQLTSKWSHINRKVRKFIGVYEECSRSRRSGTNDADVLRLATTRYQDNGHQGNVPIDLWRILSRSPKWQQLNNPDSGSSKKRSSVDAEVEVDETIGSSDQIPPFNVADSDDEDPIPRPIGRKKAKSIASGSGGFGFASISSRDEIGRAMVEQLRVFNLREEERLKLKEKELKRKEQDDEIKIMETDLSTLSGFKRMIYEQRQREIKANYNLP